MMIGELTRDLIAAMSRSGAVPLNIEVSNFSNLQIVNAFDSKTGEVISGDVFTGMSESPNEAILKCLSEYAERNAQEEWAASNPDLSIYGTDGFAAFPRFDLNAKGKARQIAYHECVERFVWANWWDNSSFRANVAVLNVRAQRLLSKLTLILPLRRVFLIRPEIEGATVDVQIFFAELETGGFISGGAAGAFDSPEVRIRAMSELIRHGLAFVRILKQSHTSNSLYERRLKFFASGLGTSKVLARLEKKGNSKIIIPQLIFDSEVRHSLSHLFAIHRCQLENQPLFIGGEMERLCL